MTFRTAAVTAKSAVVMSTGQRDARGAQSFVQILELCWRRPSLLGRELLWRWVFGIPLMAALGWAGVAPLAGDGGTAAGDGRLRFFADYPTRGRWQVMEAIQVLLWARCCTRWCGWCRLAIVLAAVAGGLGRNAVLRRYRPEQPWKPAAMIVLQMLRMVALVASFVVWFGLIRWAANFEPDRGVAAWQGGGRAESGALLRAGDRFFAGDVHRVGAAELGFLDCAAADGAGRAGCRREPWGSLRLGPLTGKLVEINLVMGIVKLALIVLAMVLSAVPLPSEAQVQGTRCMCGGRR